jgi:GDP-D-mannose 3',5'-epimerase
MATDKVHSDYYESSKLAKFPFEPYWPEKKLKICVTGAGGFIASHLAKRLKSEGHHIVAVDWKRNEHMPVSGGRRAPGASRGRR